MTREEKLVGGASLPTIPLKYETLKVDVLQSGVRRLKELLCLVQP